MPFVWASRRSSCSVRSIGMDVMRRFYIDGVFYLMATAACLLALLATVRSVVSASPPRLKRPFDILAPQAARLAHDPLDSSGTHQPLNAVEEELLARAYRARQSGG